jgi:hypothetical protein
MTCSFIVNGSSPHLHNGGEQPEDDYAAAVLDGQRRRWFAHVESGFRAKGVMEEQDRFDHTVAALSKKIIQLCFTQSPTQTTTSRTPS